LTLGVDVKMRLWLGWLGLPLVIIPPYPSRLIVRVVRLRKHVTRFLHFHVIANPANELQEVQVALRAQFKRENLLCLIPRNYTKLARAFERD